MDSLYEGTLELLFPYAEGLPFGISFYLKHAHRPVGWQGSAATTGDVNNPQNNRRVDSGAEGIVVAYGGVSWISVTGWSGDSCASAAC